MAEKESIIFRMEFKDPNLVPTPDEMIYIVRLVDEIFKNGGVLVLPEKITAQWLQEKLDETIKNRVASGRYVDIKIVDALKAIVVERVRLEFPDTK